MSNRRYRLLCPISRALDHVGDRWAMRYAESFDGVAWPRNTLRS